MSTVLALGNPGARYARTRHNVAWRVADELVGRWRAVPLEKAATYRAWRAMVGEAGVNVVLPLAYMNLSGEALLAFRERHGDAEPLLVVSDDVYLPVGTIRLRARGSSGGHRGLESIEAALGTRDYARLRIGVGESESDALGDHVLEDFTEDEERRIGDAVAAAADAVETWIREGLIAAMNRFNRKASEEDLTT